PTRVTESSTAPAADCHRGSEVSGRYPAPEVSASASTAPAAATNVRHLAISTPLVRNTRLTRLRGIAGFGGPTRGGVARTATPLRSCVRSAAATPASPTSPRYGTPGRGG